MEWGESTGRGLRDPTSSVVLLVAALLSACVSPPSTDSGATGVDAESAGDVPAYMALPSEIWVRRGSRTAHDAPQGNELLAVRWEQKWFGFSTGSGTDAPPTEVFVGYRMEQVRGRWELRMRALYERTDRSVPGLDGGTWDLWRDRDPSAPVDPE